MNMQKIYFLESEHRQSSNNTCNKGCLKTFQDRSVQCGKCLSINVYLGIASFTIQFLLSFVIIRTPAKQTATLPFYLFMH